MTLKRSLLTALFLSLLVPVYAARATPELDRRYALTALGILRAWDNVDGLFGDIVNDAYQRRLARESRFVVHDLAKANTLLTSTRLPYNKIIDDADILAQLGKSMKLDSVLRTKVYKEGPEYKFVMDWVHVAASAGAVQTLASEEFRIEEPFDPRGTGQGGEQFQRAISTGLDRLLKKVPFHAMVTGRDQKAVTVNIGARSGIQKGDTFVIATLDEVKFHPLLKTIVDWRLTTTGKATVTEVDEGMAFADIDVEEYGRQIARYQKVIQVIPAPEAPAPKTQLTDYDERERAAREPPRLGWISPGVFVGGHSREASTNNGASGFTGGGTMLGFKAEGQVWFTSEWFGELDFAYGSSSFSQEDIATDVKTPAADVTASLTQFRASVGYMYHLTANFFGPKAFGRVGYHSTSFSLPNTASELTSPVRYSGLSLGIGGDLPIRGDYGMLLAVDVGLFSGGTEEGSYYGTDTGATSVDVHLGAYTWLKPKLKLRLGFDFKSHSMDFANGATLSNKVFAFGPSVMFYF